MRNGRRVLRNLYFYLIPDCLQSRQMWIKSTILTSFNSLNSLSRSRKIIITVLVGLVLLYYLGPFLFRSGSSHLGLNSAAGCLDERLSLFSQAIANSDFVVNRKENDQIAGSKLYPPYVGNGYVAAAFNSESGLFIRLNRALSLPLNFYPVVQTHITHDTLHEATALDLRAGLAYKIQTFKKGWGCVSVGSQMYAHRSRHSVLVQDFRLQNPSKAEVKIDLDRTGMSGWKGAETKDFSTMNHLGERVKYQITTGVLPIPEMDTKVVAVAIGMVSMDSSSITLKPHSTTKLHFTTVVHYTSKPVEKHEAERYFTDLSMQVQTDMQVVLKISGHDLRAEHTKVWNKLWESGFFISESKASGALNGDKINSTLYYILSNVRAPLHDPTSTITQRQEIQRILYYPDRCYSGHSTLHADTLWADARDEDEIARVVTTWMITLEKQGCAIMVQSGAEGVLQAFMLSLGALKFLDHHLELGLHPRDLHRDLLFRRLNYGNNSHVNISVTVGEDNKANLFVSLDRNDRPYYACDAGCLDPPVQLDNSWKQFPVKLTDPLTSILYITFDKEHMQELKHAIHVKAIEEAPPHEHHVMALHKHGHHFGGLPTLFWVSIAFLIIIFHLFLFKLIYNEYCQGQERYQRTRYTL